MQIPPQPPDDDHSDENQDDLVNKVYGPSQSDIDRSWEGYNTGGGGQRIGGLIWKVTIAVVSIVILASMSLGILGPLLGGSSSPEQEIPERVTAEVLRVIDGRTIVVNAGDGERTVRLIGVGAHAFGDPFYSFGQEVTQSWLNGKQVLLEADAQDADDQGRLMRYVFLEEVMINAAFILNGLAEQETQQPNVRYDAYLDAMESQARESGVGIWDSSFGSQTEADDSQALNRLPTVEGPSAS
jgi:endonuclease YncB( thermonuclease family)